ncbi:hypothetical protein SMACR_02044 [Sordaria macrospora]|uniref:WGS project CABT00000000 data, contig 2.18 n=2 Tax=Sordaria macrospora TaxID=5147 RepID=F7W0T4_SORMK|nr:uncharacterized protein SMAC_02044 [Sordaria macrospora k-hell]KAA8632958.1 hypothetical protein SMACR_02044 [Sordaria macrospora]WPJ63877.1 hypothetical protein SMAC4_02044 [Sordaria macrospora]CCC11386.1 unnamed protein product [Sordaria macrospora k-hell]
MTSIRMKLAIWLAFFLNFAAYFPAFVYATLWMGIGHKDDLDSLATLQAEDAPGKLIKTGFIVAALIILLDVYIFCLPWPVIGSLESLKKTEKRRERVKVYAVFGTAAMGIVASIVSCVFKVKQEGSTVDLMWSTGAVVISVSVEANIAVIVASVPGFSKFLRFHVAPWPPVKRILEGWFRVKVHDSNDHNVPRSGRDQLPMGMVNQQGNMPRELKESWLFKSDKSQSSENSGTTHQEEQEQQQERVDQVGYELKSKGVVTVVEAGGKKKMEEEQQEAVQQDDVDLEKGLGKGHGAQEERS